MTTPSTPMELSKKSQEGIVAFQYQCYNLMMQQYNIREQMRQIDLAYIRENDLTVENWRGRIANAWGDASKFQNITVPVVKPQVETSVTYQASVFLTGTPLFGVVSSPKYEDEAMQMETVIDENSVRGAWKRELMMAFRDGFKYNLSACEIAWDRETVTAFENDPLFGDGTQGKPKETIWQGNCLKRMDLYNTFWDTRVEPTHIHMEGEFAGYSQLMGRVQLKQYIAELPDKMISNINAAFESGFGGWSSGAMAGGIMSYYIPPINPNALINKNMYATMDWNQWAGLTGAMDSGVKVQYQNLYEVTVMYARILPSDFLIAVPGKNTPQVWKFILINHQVIIYAERQTNAHGFLPILFSQPNEDGLRYQTKSLADDAMPMQSVSSALMNGVVAARRRSLTDRVLYDPSRISEAAINSSNPSAKIPCKPAAYGKVLSESVYQFPYKDDQSVLSLNEINTIEAMTDRISGHNKAQQGMFVKGNKTRHEYEDVMSHASGRDQLCSILLEDQFFTPLKFIIKSNILQYQQGASYYNRTEQKDVKIDPVALRNAIFEFKVSDGLVPADKLINADVASIALQQIGSSKTLAAGYNTPKLFSYIIQTQGGDLKDFEKTQPQLLYEQAIEAWNASMQIALEMFKTVMPAAAKDTPVQDLVKVVQAVLPPQPKPQDYGYNPAPQPQQPRTTPTQTGVPT